MGPPGRRRRRFVRVAPRCATDTVPGAEKSVQMHGDLVISPALRNRRVARFSPVFPGKSFARSPITDREVTRSAGGMSRPSSFTGRRSADVPADRSAQPCMMSANESTFSAHDNVPAGRPVQLPRKNCLAVSKPSAEPFLETETCAVSADSFFTPNRTRNRPGVITNHYKTALLSESKISILNFNIPHPPSSEALEIWPVGILN